MKLKDLPDMTVTEHHMLCLGVLACCYRHVDSDLKQAIYEACEAAKNMGANICPENLILGRPLKEFPKC